MEHVKINNHRYYQFETILDNYPKLKYPGNKNLFIKKYKIPVGKYIHAIIKNTVWCECDELSTHRTKLFIRKTWFDVSFNIEPKIPALNCVYLIKIGTVSDYRIPYNINSSYKNYPIYKWGRTTDLYERYRHHRSTYKKISGNDIEISHYCALNPINVVNVETIVANFFKSNNFKLIHDKYQELAIIPDEKLHHVISFYDNIQNNEIVEVSDYINKNQSKNQSKNIPTCLNVLSPSIYLFKIGSVKNLRDSMNIDYFYDNTDLVVHWGFSYDLLTRTSHYNSTKSYGGIPGSNINLLISTRIDSTNILTARNFIVEYFLDQNYHFEYNNDSEFAIIPKNKLKIIKEQYALAGKSYESHLPKINTQLLAEKYRADLAKKDIQLKKYRANLIKKDTQLEKCRAEIAEKEAQLMKKEIEILQLKLAIRDK